MKDLKNLTDLDIRDNPITNINVLWELKKHSSLKIKTDNTIIEKVFELEKLFQKHVDTKTKKEIKRLSIDLLKNCRKIQDYSTVDEILNQRPNILEKNNVTVLYELVFYYDSKGERLRLKDTLKQIEELSKNKKSILKTLLNLYIKYGSIEDVNRIRSILYPSSESEDYEKISIDILLEKMQQMEESTKKAILSDLINGISHEFGQPITNITYMLQYYQRMLEDTVSKEEVMTIFSSIQEEINRLNGLVKTIAPITSSKSSKEKFDIVQTIQQRLNLMETKLKDNYITYQVKSDPANIFLYQDPVKFDQIINNLLLNSIDSLIEKEAEQKWIDIQLSVAGEKILIDFKDNGVGIPERNRKNIFLPFYTTKKNGKGEGLGLYIIWNLLKWMGGEIFLDHSYNDGAFFKIEIPLKQDGEPDGKL